MVGSLAGKVWEESKETGMWDKCALGDVPYRRQRIKDALNKQILLKCCCSCLL